MKSRTRIRIMTFVVLSSFLVFPLVCSINFNRNVNILFRRDDNTIDDQYLRISAMKAKIYIKNNWSAAKDAGTCTGVGTYSNPYVIEDLVIDADGLSNGILIEASEEFFRIENVTIYNTNSSGLTGGIKLNNSNNGILINNSCYNNIHGIILWSSDNNSISGNILYNNSDSGMEIWWGDNNDIFNNIAYNNSNCGIWLGGYNNSVNDNLANNNRVGMILNQIHNDVISGNIANNNTDAGIRLYYCDNNNISGNTAQYNDYGIYLRDCYHNTISENTANSNSNLGIYLDVFSWYNEILENNINNNNRGIRIYNSIYNTIYFNNFKNNALNVLYLISYTVWVNSWNSEKKILYTYNGNNFTNYLGNYWENYMGIDADNDGIGDTPYVIGEIYSDNYPLMEPIENYIFIEIIEPSNGRIIPGYNLFFLLNILSLVVLVIGKKIKK